MISTIHSAGDIVHRGECASLDIFDGYADDNLALIGISTRCIGLTARDPLTQSHAPSKLVKIGKVGYQSRLLELHRSNSFGPSITSDIEAPIPDAWSVIFSFELFPSHEQGV